MKLKASEYLAMQVDRLQDISQFLNSKHDNLAFEIRKDIEEIERNLTELYILMIQKEQEKLRRSEL